MIGEFFVEIIFRRFIVGFLGFYTLFFIFKLSNHEKGLKWIENPLENEGDEFGKGCIVAIVGIIAFAALFLLIGYLFFK